MNHFIKVIRCMRDFINFICNYECWKFTHNCLNSIHKYIHMSLWLSPIFTQPHLRLSLSSPSPIICCFSRGKSTEPSLHPYLQLNQGKRQLELFTPLCILFLQLQETRESGSGVGTMEGQGASVWQVWVVVCSS